MFVPSPVLDDDYDDDEEEGPRKRNNPVSSRLRRKQVCGRQTIDNLENSLVFLASVTRIGLHTGGSFILKCNLSFCLQRKLVNEKGETPLHEAAIAGNTQRVKSLLEKVGVICFCCSLTSSFHLVVVLG